MSSALLQTLVVAGVGSACKAFLHGASRTTIEGSEIMRAALERPRGQALITVSNHVGSIDDPLITSAVVPSEYLTRPEVGDDGCAARSPVRVAESHWSH